MNTSRTVVVGLVTALVGVTAGAQSATVPGGAPPASVAAPAIVAATPGECTRSANEWRNAQLAPVMAAMRQASPETRDSAIAKFNELYRGVSREVVRVSKDCAAGFAVEKVPATQLVDLVALYSFVGDTAQQRRATERALAATDLPPRQHGRVMLLLVQQEIGLAKDYFGMIDGAERVVAQIDALPDSLADLKISAHQTMMGRYEYLDVDEGLRIHASAVLSLARRTMDGDSASARAKRSSVMTSAYLSLARSAADLLHPDSALMILDNAERELGPEVAPRFADFRDRYALIGTKAAEINAEWWLNTDAPAAIKPGDGRVRFIEFTAHWCGPCKNSYPGVRSIAERFRAAPFEGVMVTSLYGYIGARQHLTAEEEVAADREYFTKEHALPFKVAVNSFPKNVTPPAYRQPQVDRDYRVGGIPQIVIIDKRGLVRQIVTGWDQGNTRRIGDLIGQLLKEGDGRQP